jgi:hypothetical protein
VKEFFTIFFQALATILAVLIWMATLAVPIFWCFIGEHTTPTWFILGLSWGAIWLAASIAAVELFD